MMTSRRIEDLDPKVQPVCQAHIDVCRTNGIEIILTATERDAEAQDELFKIGRIGDARATVTDARGWQSWHQYKCAWDVAPIVHGRIPWDDHAIWQKIGELGEQVGAAWGGRWTKPNRPDRPHFEVKPLGLTTAKAYGLFQKSGTIFV